jgi:hypothetical protein
VEDGLSEVSATKADEAAVRRPDKHLGRTLPAVGRFGLQPVLPVSCIPCG